MTKGRLKLYFESERRSKGGPVNDIEKIEEHDCFVITFEKEEGEEFSTSQRLCIFFTKYVESIALRNIQSKSKHK